MNEDLLLQEAIRVREQADCLFTADQVSAAARRMAVQITDNLGDSNPLMLCVMNGGLLPISLLLPQLDFPLKLDYLHATRYREDTRGQELVWQRSPNQSMRGRDLLIVDDILDEGHTLAGILDACAEQQPNSLQVAVLTRKTHGRGVNPHVDYVGLDLPDRYVFGCGMDYKGYWRNLPGIYAVKET